MATSKILSRWWHHTHPFIFSILVFVWPCCNEYRRISGSNQQRLIYCSLRWKWLCRTLCIGRVACFSHVFVSQTIRTQGWALVSCGRVGSTQWMDDYPLYKMVKRSWAFLMWRQLEFSFDVQKSMHDYINLFIKKYYWYYLQWACLEVEHRVMKENSMRWLQAMVRCIAVFGHPGASVYHLRDQSDTLKFMVKAF